MFFFSFFSFFLNGAFILDFFLNVKTEASSDIIITGLEPVRDVVTSVFGRGISLNHIHLNGYYDMLTFVSSSSLAPKNKNILHDKIIFFGNAIVVDRR